MNADRLAPNYRWLEYLAFGRELEHARVDFLSYAADARRILIVGEGDGRFLARLVESNRHASIAVIEASAQMIDLARQRIPLAERSRVEFHHIDAVNGPLPEGPFDLAVTHFFLDILDFHAAEAVILKVRALLTASASWLVSEFQEPSGNLRLMHARLWLRTMYWFFSATTGLRVSKLPPYSDLLAGFGFVEVDYRERRLGLIRSQVWRKRS
jgi:ubiquinone/menaquinone biosynthesis C-methylase UbiE